MDQGAKAAYSRNRNTTWEGMRFGSAPVVTAQLYWEAYFLHDYYRHGIIGYGVDQESGKSYVDLLDGTKKMLKSPDDRSGLAGLMPAELQKALGGGGAKKKASSGGSRRGGRRRR